MGPSWWILHGKRLTATDAFDSFACILRTGCVMFADTQEIEIRDERYGPLQRLEDNTTG